LTFQPQIHVTSSVSQGHSLYQVIIIIIIKNKKIKVALCENAAGAIYIVSTQSLSYAADKQTDRQTNRGTRKSIPTPTDKVGVRNFFIDNQCMLNFG